MQKKNSRLEERRKKIPREIDLFVRDSFDIVDRVHQILTSQGKEQKDLARALGKKESEISKWMTGTHNFTIKTLAKISAVLGEPVIKVTSNDKKETGDIVRALKEDYSTVEEETKHIYKIKKEK